MTILTSKVSYPDMPLKSPARPSSVVSNELTTVIHANNRNPIRCLTIYQNPKPTNQIQFSKKKSQNLHGRNLWRFQTLRINSNLLKKNSKCNIREFEI